MKDTPLEMFHSHGELLQPCTDRVSEVVLQYLDALARASDVDSDDYQHVISRAEDLMQTYLELAQKGDIADTVSGWRLHLQLATKSAALRVKLAAIPDGEASGDFLKKHGKDCIALKSSVLTCKGHGSSDPKLAKIVEIGEGTCTKLANMSDQVILSLFQNITKELTDIAGGAEGQKSWKEDLPLAANWSTVLQKAQHLMEGSLAVALNKKYRRAEEDCQLVS